MDVFILHHVHEFDDESEEVKLIGIYSTMENAQSAIQRMLLQPGFREHPEGFCVDCYTLDQDHWSEGFVTATE